MAWLAPRATRPVAKSIRQWPVHSSPLWPRMARSRSRATSALWGLPWHSPLNRNIESQPRISGPTAAVVRPWIAEALLVPEPLAPVLPVSSASVPLTPEPPLPAPSAGVWIGSTVVGTSTPEKSRVMSEALPPVTPDAGDAEDEAEVETAVGSDDEGTEPASPTPAALSG